jgi:hypothetical protein
MSLNSACNCCSVPPYPLALAFGYKEKLVKSKFCPTSFQTLWPYLSKAAGTLTPSDPPNPAEGSLFSSLSVSYFDSGESEHGPGDGICWDTVSGQDTFELSANLTEKVNEDLKIKNNDLNRDSPSDQQCSSQCGGPSNPLLEGGGGRDYYSIRNYTSLVQGGCGADYGYPTNHCGVCDPIEEESFYCYGDGSEPITSEDTTTETFSWSVNGCKAYSQPSYADYPSAQGTATTTSTSEANCCFSFVCQAQVNSSPSPNPFSQTTTQPYNIVDLPFDLEKTTTTPVEPIDISDVIDAAFSKLDSIEYFAPEGEEYFWETSYQQLQVSYGRFSSPFSESGFSNYAEVTLSQKEYIIRIGAPPPTCYIKLWFVEEFLPSPLPENWEIGLDGQPIPQRLSSFEIEHDFQTGGVIPKKCYKDTNINFTGEDGFSFVPENSTLLTPEPRTLTPPDEVGTKTVRLLKYSLLKDYTPKDPYLVLDPLSGQYFYTQDCKPNGYPNPTAATNDPRISCE